MKPLILRVDCESVHAGQVTFKARYVRGAQLIYREDAEGKAYYLQNGHGDITALRLADGTLVSEYAYDIWGNPLPGSEQQAGSENNGPENPAENPFRYSGEYWDEATGLQYLRSRWYDPGLGRFIQEDTFEGYMNRPSSLNPYVYVENTPLTNIDPTGHYCVSADGKYAHAGTCNLEGSVYLGEGKEFSGRPVLWNGVMTGTIRNKATIPSYQVKLNYWTTYTNDYSYVRWLAGDNNYYYNLNRDTQLELRQRLLSNYMSEQIEQGFPNFIDGFMWGKSLAKKGITTLLGAKKGTQLRGGSKSSRDNWYGYDKNKEFVRWWHRSGKKEFGGNDFDNKNEIKSIYEYWIQMGKPKVK
ncbi:RHS repeat-associated core domain-containing protein [Paenibacillus sp. JSM ZJ436]|uniref:RHS repeat-associated core domain-containing protein n=1 Tax=Paenibacillus sp. JSM ZJ436 TaxID=3376190 RepID=UPI0037B38CE8